VRPPRARLALWIDHLRLLGWFYQRAVTNLCGIVGAHHLVESLDVSGGTEDQGGDHLDLGWARPAFGVQEVTEFLDSLMQGLGQSLTESLRISLAEAKFGVEAGTHFVI
jgi:hypothetical protein